MPTAAYIGFVDAADGDKPNAGSLMAQIKADLTLPGPDRLLSLAAGIMAYFEFPTRMLAFAHALGARVRRTDWALAPVRGGIHVATLSMGGSDAEPSLSTRTVENATRIAACAKPGQILASREFHTVVTRILKIDASHFRALPPEPRPAGVPAELYEILPTGGNVGGKTALSPEYMTLIERALAEEIGPLAGFLVKQARDASFDRNDLAARLSESIPPGPRRAAFLARVARLAGA